MGAGLEPFSVIQRPLGFGFGTKGFGAMGLGKLFPKLCPELSPLFS